MPTRLRIHLLLVSIATLILVTFALFYSPAHEPTYQGKKMSAWIDALGNGALDTFTLQREFAKMGPDALRPLTQALRRRNLTSHTVYAALYPKLPSAVRAKLPPPCDAVMVRCNAINVLGFMATNALVAIPALLRSLADPDARVRQNAAGALGGVRSKCARFDPLHCGAYDAEAVTLLMTALKDSDRILRGNAAVSVKEFGEAAANATPVLLEMARNDTGQARANAIRALDQIGQVPAEVLPVLRAARDDADKDVRDAARSLVERYDQHQVE